MMEEEFFLNSVYLNKYLLNLQKNPYFNVLSISMFVLT